MKKFILTMFIFMLQVSVLLGVVAEPVRHYGWNVYTNTSYIHQIEERGDSILAATWGGVSIFQKDSESFKILDSSDGLLRNEIRSIHYIQSLDQTWIGTLSEGISRYYKGDFISPYQVNQGIDAEIIYDICDNGDYIFIGSNKGLAMLEMNETEDPTFINTFTAPQWLSDNHIRSIAFDDSNRIWLATDSGINYVEISYDNMILPQNWKTFTTSQTSEEITSIEYYNGKIYYGSTDGFAIIDSIYKPELDINDVEVFNGSGLPSRSISDIEVKSDSIIWLAFGEWNEEFQRFDDAAGISRYTYDGIDWDYEHWGSSDSLCEQISDIYISSEGIVWAASWGEGIFRFMENSSKNGSWEKYKKKCIATNIIGGMLFDSRRDLWCAFSRINLSPISKKGVSRFDGKEWFNYDVDNSGLGFNTVYSIGEDQDNNIWFGHWGSSSKTISILKFPDNEWSVYGFNYNDWILSGSTALIYNDDYGNMWVGGYAAGPGGVTVIPPQAELMPDSSYHQFAPEILEGGEADMISVLRK